MKNLFLALLSCILLNIVAPHHINHLRIMQAASESSTTLPTICQQAKSPLCPQWDQWKQQWNKTYSPEDEFYRHSVFCQNCVKIINQQSSTYVGELNMFADLTDQEKQHRNGPSFQNISYIQEQTRKEGKVAANLADQKVGLVIPATLDYRNYNGNNYVTSVKDQGSCGCCWSFAATASYESYLRLNGFSYDLSAQAALECTSYYAPNKRVSDCSGGYFSDVLYFLADVGSVLDSSYPYIAGNYGSRSGFPNTPGICSEHNRIFLGKGTADIWAVPGGLTQLQIKNLLMTNGPLMIGIYANAGFFSYKSGTYSGCPANSVNFINHAILLVGWTSTGWIAKNQYGTNWGNNGYIELDFTYDCGMKYIMGSVLVSNKNTNVQVYMDPGVTWEPHLGASLAFLLLLLAFLLQ